MARILTTPSMPGTVRHLLLLVVCIVAQISCGPRDGRLRHGRDVVRFTIP